MIDPHEFAKKQLELTAEFGKYVFDHPEVDEQLPDGAYVYFEVAGEPEFNEYSRSPADANVTERHTSCLGAHPRIGAASGISSDSAIRAGTSDRLIIVRRKEEGDITNIELI